MMYCNCKYARVSRAIKICTSIVKDLYVWSMRAVNCFRWVSNLRWQWGALLILVQLWTSFSPLQMMVNYPQYVSTAWLEQQYTGGFKLKSLTMLYWRMQATIGIAINTRRRKWRTLCCILESRVLVRRITVGAVGLMDSLYALKA